MLVDVQLAQVGQPIHGPFPEAELVGQPSAGHGNVGGRAGRLVGPGGFGPGIW
jgi:hypothetical protein